jgi:hypothetical protein
MFRALHAHLQESLHKQLVYYLRVVCEPPPEDDQVMLETCRGP